MTDRHQITNNRIILTTGMSFASCQKLTALSVTANRNFEELVHTMQKLAAK